MAQSKSQQNALRSMLLNNGTIHATAASPSTVRHIDKKASQAAAIAARRADCNVKPIVRFSETAHKQGA